MGLIIVLGSELRSCVKVEVDVLGSPVPNKPTVSVDAKQHFNNNNNNVFGIIKDCAAKICG